MLYQLSYAHQVCDGSVGLGPSSPSRSFSCQCFRRARQESNLRPAA